MKIKVGQVYRKVNFKDQIARITEIKETSLFPIKLFYLDNRDVPKISDWSFDVFRKHFEHYPVYDTPLYKVLNSD